jgi:dipeptidase E
MNLLLLSSQLGAVREFLPTPTQIGFIPTAASLDPNPWYVDQNRQQLTSLGHQLIYLDLDHLSTVEINARLDAVDALFVTGGNAFYLMQQLRRKNLAATLADRIRHGLPYLGVSAGAAILGPTLAPLATLDDPAAAPHLQGQAGLGFVPFVPLPHYGAPKYADRYERILADLSAKYRLVTFRDDQAIRVTGAKHRIIASPPVRP